eukprot:TRINITY_DN1533_c0_g2_i2.p1 TRINITY_DN1533_c0_g2~~TRINITY_DN1533_c0_g2_i2.p1  ORF type:complete len:660 (-),score=192.88 TRINITY_DN1533_c0_g2_i2:91-2070(-)
MNFAAYTSLSFLGAAICFGSAYQTYTTTENIDAAYQRILGNKLNILVIINLAYNILFLFGKFIQWLVFGPLRPIETKNIYDRLLNYILLKVVFVVAILEPSFAELVIWSWWFSILGFMKIFSLLTRDRFEHITTSSPHTRSTVHYKLIAFLALIVCADVTLFITCVRVFEKVGASVLLLLTFECFTLFLDTVQTLVKYAIHLIDISRDGIWEERGTYIYYTEFTTDILILLGTLGHYIQIFALHGVSLTVIDALLFFHMRIVFLNLKTKIAQYRNYRQLALNLQNQYPTLTIEQMRERDPDADDTCAVCHDPMRVAKQLPCGHVFHTSCLRSWLEYHSNCPTCRHSLISSTDANPNPTLDRNSNEIPPENTRSVVRWQGGRWFRWLPTIEIHTQRNHRPMGPLGTPGNSTGNSPNLAEMIRQLQEIVPHVPSHILAADLRITGNVNDTLENVLEGRIEIPPETHTFTPSPMGNLGASVGSVGTGVGNLGTSRFSPATSPVSSTTASPAPSTSTSTSPVGTLGTVGTLGSGESIEPKVFAGSFSTSSKDRHMSLQQRKQQMIEHARKQFLQKSNSPAASEIKQEISSAEGKQEVESPVSIQTPNQDIAPITSNVTNVTNVTPSVTPSVTTVTNVEPEEDSVEIRRRKMLAAAQSRIQNPT